jgi:hypothetical protein
MKNLQETRVLARVGKISVGMRKVVQLQDALMNNWESVKRMMRPAVDAVFRTPAHICAVVSLQF